MATKKLLTASLLLASCFSHALTWTMREVNVTGETNLEIRGINNASQMSAVGRVNRGLYRINTSGQVDYAPPSVHLHNNIDSGGINEDGDVVITGNPVAGSGGTRVAYWTPGVGMTNLAVLDNGGYYWNESFAMNNAHTAVGWAQYTGPNNFGETGMATVYSPSSGYNLNPGYWNGYNMAKDIDEAGNIVGCVNLDPILWRPDGTFVDLTQPNTYGAACAISSSGLISGTLSDASGKHLAIWNLSGQLLHKIYIGDRFSAPDPRTEICFMNDNGEVVVTAVRNGFARSFFWSQSSGLVDITGSIANTQGLSLTMIGINNRREIIANGYSGNIYKYNLLLTPVPEPSAFAVMAAGLTALLLPLRRRKKR